MRITNGMMMRKYGRNLNINLGRMNKTSTQIESGKRFQRASEDPVRALKSLQVRRNLSSLEQYKSNIETVDAWITQTETAVSAIKSHADKATDLILQGRNDPVAAEDRQIIATALRNVQDALLKDLNSQVAGKYLLGGANTKEVPFTVHRGADEPNDPDPLKLGHLLFNGEDIFEVENIDELESLYTKVYADLTGEFQLKSESDNIEEDLVDKSTLFNMFTTGVSIIGVGPNNLYNLIGRIAYSFESEFNSRINITEEFDPASGLTKPTYYTVAAGISRMEDIDGPIRSDLSYLIDDNPVTGELSETSKVQQLIDKIDELISKNSDLSPGEIDRLNSEKSKLQAEQVKLEQDYNLYGGDAYVNSGDGLFKLLQDAQVNSLIQLVNVGEKSNFITYLSERNEEYIYQAEVMQNTLEAMPADEAIMAFKMQDYVYKACLQMGSYIFQPSLMDYIKK